MSPPTAGVPPLGEELVPPGEAAAVQTVADVCLELMEVAKSPVPRQQHGKGHGCVRALYHVTADVPAELRHGILATPLTYQAIIRLSNGRQTNDREKDAHGLALKLFGVPGKKVLEEEQDATTQDFIFMDHGTFFIRDAFSYAEFSIAMRNGARRAKHFPSFMRNLVTGLHLMRKFFLKHSAEKGFIQKVRSEPPASPLQAQYHSVCPAKLGPHAVRWTLVPRPLSAPIETALAGMAMDDRLREDRLRLAMVQQLKDNSAHFEVYVQRQTDPVRMPVEDPTVAWDELVAPLVRVATIEIPAQEFDTAHKREVGDALAFTNWHCLPEHRPLGGINRVRRGVYHAVSARRRVLNGQVAKEPGDDWLDRVWDAGSTHAAGSASAPPMRG